MIRSLLVLFFLIAASPLLHVVCAQSAAQSSPSRERDALRAGGLRAAAKAFGHYSVSFEEEEWGQYDLKQLTTTSDIVIKGTPVLTGASLSSDGLSIDSFFSLQPAAVFKGTPIMLAKSSLVVPGGLIKFDDGTTAEVINPLEKGLESGGTYFFFLKKKSDGLHLVGSSQGLVAIDTIQQTVTSKAKSQDGIVSDLRGRSPYDLGNVIRSYSTSQ